MRFMPAILAQLFKPVPTMDAHTEPNGNDPIAHEIGAVVAEHERVASGVRDVYAARLREMTDDLFRMLDSKDDARG